MRIRVFLVEDFPHLRRLIGELFDAVGGLDVVATADTEAEANLWLEENSKGWDLVIVDLVLEQGSGMNVIQRARGSNPAGSIVVFSSYASDGVREHCLSVGADAVFDKGQTRPFTEWLGAFVAAQGA